MKGIYPSGQDDVGSLTRDLIEERFKPTSFFKKGTMMEYPFKVGDVFLSNYDKYSHIRIEDITPDGEIETIWVEKVSGNFRSVEKAMRRSFKELDEVNDSGTKRFDFTKNLRTDKVEPKVDLWTL